MYRELRKRGIREGNTFFCTNCNMKGCVPFGGVRGSLVFCGDCYYNGVCARGVQVRIICCCDDLYEPIKQRKKKRVKMTAQKRRKLRREKC